MRVPGLIAALLLLVFTLTSCGGDENKGKSAKEVIDKYTDTLSTAPERAREAGRKVEERTRAMEEKIRAIE